MARLPRRFAAAALLLAAGASLLPAPASGLSWPLCDDGGQVWVTERPHTEPTFPGANLWYFCESGLNVLGVSVDPCVRCGTVCSEAVLNMLCQALGFDKLGGDASIANASRNEAVRSLTGEYCLRAGVYAAAVPDDLASLPGDPCTKVDGITCVRLRQTIATALGADLAAFQPAPPAAEPVVPADAGLTPPPQQQVLSATGPGNRKLLAEG